MKKVYFIIILLFMFFCHNVLADKPKTPNEEDLLAKCHYEYKVQNKDSKQEKNNLILYILKDYKILPIDDGIDYNPSYGSTSVSSELSYSDYMIEDKLDCSSLETVFLTLNLSGNNFEINNYSVSGTAGKTNTMYKTDPYPRKYSLVKEKSVVYVEKPTDISKEEGWLKTCHYKDFYLSFNKEKYDTNIPPVKQKDIMKYLAENHYSCPNSLCIDTYYTDGGELSEYYFSDKYKENCFVSSEFGSDYICGSISYYIETYVSLKESLKKEINLKDLNLLNHVIDSTKTFCDSVVQHLNYSDKNNCVKECLEISDIINRDLLLNGQGQCGLSGKLILFIGNIVKWVKYIIPVIIIVLGILDFIKAIGSDKDDEIKKSQTRFIRRLISAALIFIIPFILEFVLNKMGFEANGCGIIDL